MNIPVNVILGICILAFVAGYSVYTFVVLPKEKKVTNIKEWLKYAVVEAEKELGSGTGQLKLRLVYDMAVKQFPFIIHLISFEVFSTWVDEALEWMRIQLAENKATQNYVASK